MIDCKTPIYKFGFSDDDEVKFLLSLLGINVNDDYDCYEDSELNLIGLCIKYDITVKKLFEASDFLADIFKG